MLRQLSPFIQSTNGKESILAPTVNAVICLKVYNIYLNRFIKLSAPLFNNIIACGCILCLISVFLFGVHDVNNPEFAFALVCKVGRNLLRR